MNDNGWIKLSKKLLKWEWSDNPNMMALWLRLLLEANYQPVEWHGVTIERGQLLTSVATLSKRAGLTVQQTRTCLSNMQNTHEITIKTTNKYSIITICKYDSYQSCESDEQQTEQQTNNKQTNKQITNKLTTLKEDKEYKDEKNIYTPPVVPPTGTRRGVEFYGTFHNVELLPVELRTLQMNYGEADTAAAIDDLSCKLMDGTQQSIAHYATLTHWLSHRKKAAPRTNGYKGDATIGTEFTYKP